MRVSADAVQPGDIIGGVQVVLVFPGAPGRYTAVLLADHTWRHYLPAVLIEVDVDA